eukprot:2346784-Amphidinium_carterae.1
MSEVEKGFKDDHAPTSNEEGLDDDVPNDKLPWTLLTDNNAAQQAQSQATAPAEPTTTSTRERVRSRTHRPTTSTRKRARSRTPHRPTTSMRERARARTTRQRRLRNARVGRRNKRLAQEGKKPTHRAGRN